MAGSVTVGAGEMPEAAPRWWSLRAMFVLIAGAAAWVWAAHALWTSTETAPITGPHLEASRFFSSAFLERSATYSRFLEIESLLGMVTLLIVLALYALRGHRLMRESAAGRIGTGMLLGMLGFGVVWLASGSVRARRPVVAAPLWRLPPGLCPVADR